MKVRSLLLSYTIAAIVFFTIDLLWLGIIAKGIYLNFLEDLLRSDTNWYAAIIFYMIYISGLIYFAIIPAQHSNNWHKALLNGAFLGFLCYSTFELTALALLKNWPIGIVWIDILWGTFLTASVSTLTYIIQSKIKV